MDRRKLLVVAAAVVAALGVVLVLLYVRGADGRAQRRYDTVDVLVARARIEPGESIDQASSDGKLGRAAVTRNELLLGYQTSTVALAGQVAQTTIYPGEQIIASKFAATAAPLSALPIPAGRVAITVNLSDPARVAGFVEPGSTVAIFLSGTLGGQPYTRLLLPKVSVIGVGANTATSATTTGATGASDPTATTSGTARNSEPVPTTLLTLAVTQQDAQRVIFAEGNGQLTLALTTTASKVAPAPATTLSGLFG